MKVRFVTGDCLWRYCLWGESPDAQTGLTSGKEGSDGGVLIRYYTKMEGDQPVMVESLLVFEGGDVYLKDVELPGAPVLFEGVRGYDEEDECESLKRGELLESCTILPLVVVEGGDLIGDLVSIFVHLVDVIGKGGVLQEEVDNKFEGVGLEGVL